MAKAKKDTGRIELVRLQEATIKVAIVGLSPLIPHQWSEKTRRQMPGHPDKTKETKEKHNPKAEAEACLYRIGKHLAMPATAFKAATVDACRHFDKPSMVEAKQLLFVQGEGPQQLVKVKGKLELHEDLPRNANGNPDLRYRYYITDWSAEICIRYVPTLISQESVVALVDAAGRGGVGDWRPSSPKSKTGTFGTWRVDVKAEVQHG